MRTICGVMFLCVSILAFGQNYEPVADPMFAAILSEDVETMQQLLDAGYELNPTHFPRKYSALSYAVAQNKPHVVIWLLKHGADINGSDGYQEQAAISTAISNGNSNLVLLLLRNGVDAPRNPEVINQALRHGYTQIVGDLIAYGLSGDGVSLTDAISTCDLVLASQLLNCGADPNSPNKEGITPLRRALELLAHCFTEGLLDDLIRSGANVSEVLPSGHTILTEIETSKILPTSRKKMLLDYIDSLDVSRMIKKNLLLFKETGSEDAVLYVLTRLDQVYYMHYFDLTPLLLDHPEYLPDYFALHDRQDGEAGEAYCDIIAPLIAGLGPMFFKELEKIPESTQFHILGCMDLCSRKDASAARRLVLQSEEIAPAWKKWFQDDLNRELVACVRNKSIKRVSDLLEDGADPLAKDESGKTALYYANVSGNKQLINLLSRFRK